MLYPRGTQSFLSAMEGGCEEQRGKKQSLEDTAYIVIQKYAQWFGRK